MGQELIRQRDQKVVQRRRRQLPARVAAPPAVAVVEVDGGRQRTRAAGCGPGVHQPENKENKIACLLNVRSVVQEVDPQPEPPEAFLLPRRVQRLVQRIKGQAGEAVPEAAVAEAAPEEKARAAAPKPKPDPKRVRTCVATTQDSRAFGPMVAAEAQERAFYQAERRAFVADGAAYNWTIQQGYFPDFEPIADFMHVLCYIYLAAWGVGSTEAERWSLYVAWLGRCWQGRVGEVITRTWQTAHVMKETRGPLRGDTAEHDNRRIRRYVAKYTINPARAHGIAEYVGSIEVGKWADLVLWSPAFFGVKPDLIIKGGMIVAALMGDPNASIPTPEPVRYRPMFGAFGKAPDGLAATFVSRAALDSGTLPPPLRRTLLPVTNTRRIGKRDMAMNDALPSIEIDAERYTVTIDGERIEPRAASRLPLAQRYFLF